MKNKKISALIAIVLTFALLVPFTATANNVLNKDSKNSTASGLLNKDPQISADRATISKNTADIVSLKVQAKTLVKKIISDLAGTKGVDSITSSQDYKDIVSLLQSLKGTLGRAESHDYISGLKGVRGKDGANLLTGLDNVIAIQTQKVADLNTAITNLNAAVVKADAIAALKTTATSAWNTYKTQAAQKKLTIDQNRVKISSAFAEDKNIISQIIATASTSKTILLTKPEDVAAIETKLATITKSLKGIYDGSVANDSKQFNADKKNKDYTKMLADLDNIISTQQARITALASAKVQLQDILSQLNSLIG